MLLLINSTHYYVQFLVHRCDWLSADQRLRHENGVDRVCYYLLVNKDKSVILNPDQSIGVELFVYVDFRGL